MALDVFLGRARKLARRVAYPLELQRLKRSQAALEKAAERCRAVLLVNLDTGETLWSSRAQARVPIASVTKVMTALLTLDAVDRGAVKLDERLTARTDDPIIWGSLAGLAPGQEYSVDTLLDLEMVHSANDAARLLATAVAGNEAEFVAMMNARASALGLAETEFFNPHGLEPKAGFYWTQDNVSSARDQAALAAALIADHPQVLDRTAKTSVSFDGRMLANTNKNLLRRCRGVDGLKTGGSPTAGHCLVATCRRQEGRLLCVVLGAPNNEVRDQLIQALFEGGYRGARAR